MATRGFLRGMPRATAEVALRLDAAGKQQILSETVGVGQDEIDIVRLADCVVVVLVPGLGDDIQNMKAGLMEIADIFVLNKSDREGADRLEEQIHAMLSLVMPRDGWHPPVIRTVATQNSGIDNLDRKSTRLNSSHQIISYAVFCLKKKKHNTPHALRTAAPDMPPVPDSRADPQAREVTARRMGYTHNTNTTHTLCHRRTSPRTNSP